MVILVPPEGMNPWPRGHEVKNYGEELDKHYYNASSNPQNNIEAKNNIMS